MSLRNPVKYPVKYYSWQDNQAPQLSDADGVIKTILKACLVTGYGSKAGAGWTALFEDAYRIVLRRPLRTGNPPDIKIEIGTITGTTVRHRIVAQDNPSGLDDATELSAVNLLARDQNFKPAWYCFVTDFAFLLCYQIDRNNQLSDMRNNLLLVGGCKKLLDSDSDYFFVNTNASIQTTGIAANFVSGLIWNNNYAWSFYDMRRKTSYSQKNHLNLAVSETYFNNDYFVQKILVDSVAELPFFTSIPAQYANTTNSQVSIAGRNMFRYVNAAVGNYGARALYIPLDYWEL